METLVSFLIAFAVTFYFVRNYVKRLAPKAAGAAESSNIPAVPTFPCPRCSKPVAESSTFCAACGAALSMWNVHRAAVKVESQGGTTTTDKGQPKPVVSASLCIGCGACVTACPEKGTLEIVGGKAILAHPERCKGHGDCVTACPTSGIVLTWGNVVQTMRVPSVNEQFETNVPGLFIVGELGGLGLIKTAINEGKMVMEHIRRRLEAAGLWTPPAIEHNHDDAPAEAEPATEEKASEPEPDEGPCDVLIAGAGPAGLSASLAAQQYGIRYVTVEQGEVASTIRNYPRHKFLMAEPIEMPLYGNLYISDSTKEALLSVWEAILANTGVKVNTNEKVEAIQRVNGHFIVRTPRGEYQARNVVLALGKRGSPRKLNVPGEELSKVAYRLIEAESYSGNDLLVVGGGDSAIEAAMALSRGGRNRVTLSYRGPDFARLKDRNRKALEEGEASGRLQVLRSSNVKEIVAGKVRIAVQGEERELANDYVFVLIGGESPEEFLRKTGIQIVDKVVTS